MQGNREFAAAKDDYIAAGGAPESFDAIIKKEVENNLTGHFPNDSGVWKWGDGDVHESWWSAYVKFGGKEVGAVGIKKYDVA
jgi:hypothetical protein